MASRARKPRSQQRRPRPDGNALHAFRRTARPLKELADTRCIARTKVCAKCKYRYVRGDKRMQCPVCGYDRRCKNKAVPGTTVCRMHGGASPAAKGSPKFRVAHQIYNAYNSLIANPELLNLSYEIAAVTARTDELMEQLDVHDARGAAPQINLALLELEGLLADGLARQRTKRNIQTDIPVHAESFKAVVHSMRSALQPANIERNLWDMLHQNLEMTRRLNETERKWLVSNEGMVPVVLVLEVLISIQRMTLKYVRSPEDRSAFAAELRAAMPIDVVARQAG